MAIPSYITRDILKEALKRKAADTSADDLLDIAIDGSARAIYRKTGKRRFDMDAAPSSRTLPTRNRMVWDREWEKYRLMVPDIATETGLLVQSVDAGSTWTHEVVEPDDPSEPITNLLLSAAPTKVLVTATFGWPEVPGDIVQAQLLQAMRYYRRKDSPEGIAGSAEWGLFRVPRLDPDVAEMIEDYCFPAVC